MELIGLDLLALLRLLDDAGDDTVLPVVFVVLLGGCQEYKNKTKPPLYYKADYALVSTWYA